MRESTRLENKLDVLFKESKDPNSRPKQTIYAQILHYETEYEALTGVKYIPGEKE